MHTQCGKCFKAVALCLGLLVLSLFTSTVKAESLALQHTPLIQTELGRQLLKYLVGCALGPDTSMVFEHAGQPQELKGSLGLAPTWSRQPLSQEEERTVSACIFARTNFFGTAVALSLRSELGQQLAVGHAERQSFPYFEAAFFGNLFRAQAESYVCTGDVLPQRAEHLASLLRVCSLPAAAGKHASGLSRCGFTVVGACKDRPYVQNGQDYSSSVLRVYLPNPTSEIKPGN